LFKTAVKYRVAEFFLAAEVVVKVALAAKTGAPNNVIHRRLVEATLRDNGCSGIKDQGSAVTHKPENYDRAVLIARDPPTST
jgi:hypothetical protein